MRILLLPFAWIYGALILIRNYFYDKGWLRSFEFDFPVILVGNLSTGGTGKTPHVEYLLRLLMPDYKVATLSRGYKRKMKGYGLATELSLVEDIGDEPKLYKQKYPDAEVAVSEKRVIGIYYLLNDEPDVKVVILDDGMQHRRLKAGFQILLTQYNKLFTEDHMLPAGNLREPSSGKKRAHVIIVTKCPESLSSSEKNNIKEKIDPRENQKVFFTTQQYGNLYPLFDDQKIKNVTTEQDAIMVTGIAGNKEMEVYLNKNFKTIKNISFSDHHYFTDDNIKFIQLRSEGKIIITTEKDAMRLMEKKETILQHGLSIFVLPIEIKFLEDKEVFSDKVINYIKSYANAESASN